MTQPLGYTLEGSPFYRYGKRAGWLTLEVSKPASSGKALTSAMRSAALRIRGEFVPSELFALCPCFAVSKKAHGGAIAGMLKTNVIERVDKCRKVNGEVFEQVYRLNINDCLEG